MHAPEQRFSLQMKYSFCYSTNDELNGEIDDFKTFILEWLETKHHEGVIYSEWEITRFVRDWKLDN